MERLSDDDRSELAKAFDALKTRHGKALLDAGWSRADLFDGVTDLEAIQRKEEIPGVLAILWRGGTVVGITMEMITLHDRWGWRYHKSKGGGLSLSPEHQQLAEEIVNVGTA
ncbi:MAG: hypothetical protein HQL86_06955 [Magnetococcales bacterium]|nr:hypothetical protein [Magnetococcales bacterium]